MPFQIPPELKNVSALTKLNRYMQIGRGEQRLLSVYRGVREAG